MEINVKLECGIMTFTHNGTSMGVDIGGLREESEESMTNKLRQAVDELGSNALVNLVRSQRENLSLTFDPETAPEEHLQTGLKQLQDAVLDG